jgi:Flp pilus assembly protein TadB
LKRAVIRRIENIVMFEVNSMRYRDAVLDAAFRGWGDIVQNDSVYGNGFKIFAYGVRLLAWYLLAYTLRLLIALTAPLSAILVMKLYKKNEAYSRQFERKANEDL